MIRAELLAQITEACCLAGENSVVTQMIESAMDGKSKCHIYGLPATKALHIKHLLAPGGIAVENFGEPNDDSSVDVTISW